MKCPKCGYLGFETSDRCRNCGYDFSLSLHIEAPRELPLQQTSGAGAPLADFDLSTHEAARPAAHGPDLDLDRVIGTQRPVSRAAPPAVPLGGIAGVAVSEPPAVVADDEARRVRVRTASEADGKAALPLFAPESADADDTPLITSPRPVRAPLSVRRTTPDIARGRSARPPRVMSRHSEAGPELQLEPSTATGKGTDLDEQPIAIAAPAGAFRRLLAALIDVTLLAAINGAVLYLTLAIAGLDLEQARIIPPVPFGAFLLLLNAGYLIAFTAAGGQTIGKMITGIKVMSDHDQPIDLTGAVLRAAGCALSLLTMGLGYLPAFFSADGRALQDRVAGSRVVSIR
jgi:uncharacterized RDD family membrane protein YckC